MSSQKGNWSKSGGQKHQNSRTFKNNKYDTSKRTKVINSIEIKNVCERCKKILEWKIKYKKYKLLKNPATCCKCHNKCVKEPYHTVCRACSTKMDICPKCGTKKGFVSSELDGAVKDELNENDLDNEDDSESTTSSD